MNPLWVLRTIRFRTRGQITKSGAWRCTVHLTVWVHLSVWQLKSLWDFSFLGWGRGCRLVSEKCVCNISTTVQTVECFWRHKNLCGVTLGNTSTHRVKKTQHDLRDCIRTQNVLQDNIRISSNFLPNLGAFVLSHCLLDGYISNIIVGDSRLHETIFKCLCHLRVSGKLVITLLERKGWISLVLP